MSHTEGNDLAASNSEPTQASSNPPLKATQSDKELYIILCNYSDDLHNLKKRDGMLPAQAAVSAILDLIAEETNTAVIAELENMRSPHNYHIIDDRLATLKANKEQE